ncbi:hypothetical protein, partial [Legionella longbeachae]|uniref:hypothetical protein n=1 Tax=Legionella longbeachae TaxID=450 RepID=UPI00399C829D
LLYILHQHSKSFKVPTQFVFSILNERAHWRRGANSTCFLGYVNNFLLNFIDLYYITMKVVEIEALTIAKPYKKGPHYYACRLMTNTLVNDEPPDSLLNSTKRLTDYKQTYPQKM